MKSIGAFALCFAAIAVLFAAGAAAQEGQEKAKLGAFVVWSGM